MWFWVPAVTEGSPQYVLLYVCYSERNLCRKRNASKPYLWDWKVPKVLFIFTFIYLLHLFHIFISCLIYSKSPGSQSLVLKRDSRTLILKGQSAKNLIYLVYKIKDQSISYWSAQKPSEQRLWTGQTSGPTTTTEIRSQTYQAFTELWFLKEKCSNLDEKSRLLWDRTEHTWNLQSSWRPCVRLEESPPYHGKKKTALGSWDEEINTFNLLRSCRMKSDFRILKRIVQNFH